ncbi:polysaccharide deacetylase family protein [Amycolatopsis sp. PS_44_ISF1]|uniref:polysaccharide deacetylase family protein n=1 Tax=Amycolatopsis sp. PS_44_ISF1 TaxID=2974917 RepID=UPI0028DD80D4|nr:polysaccharide deacetylase family protein [Amycolatopsis sp. PS_44_ISF1]MDT8910148.1 polysaccharide deacetylase family protein [Amycolatopsis sp. PS_44_ISF1]
MTGRPPAIVSVDLDNLWAYLKTHGDPGWRDHPSFLPAAVPRLLDVLGGQHLRATVFVVGADAVREDGAKAVNEIAAAGHEVANHSFGHEPWLHRYSRDRLDEELSRTEDAIVAAGAPVPSGFRGPGYSVTRELVELLVERGYRYDASTWPTWIGPLARAYHNRGTSAAAAEATDTAEEGRDELFGGFSRVFAPVHPYRWRTDTGARLVELPVTTMPLLRTPIHGSYLVQLNAVSPRLARGYFRTALRLCLGLGVTPSLLLHPTDVLEGTEAPGMEFFPGMGARSGKAALVSWALRTLCEQFDVVGTGEYVRRSPVRRERPVARLDARR